MTARTEPTRNPPTRATPRAGGAIRGFGLPVASRQTPRATHHDPYPNPHRPGLTTLGFIFSLALVSALLGSLVVVSTSLREQNAQYDTEVILASLRQALNAYHDKYQAYPPGPTENALAILLAEPSLQTLVMATHPVADSRGRLIVRDGYGNPIHYEAPPQHERGLPQAADQVPDLAVGGGADPTPRGRFFGAVDFVSPGADGKLGDMQSNDPNQRQAVTDNLYGADMERPLP